jgi:flagellar biosynthesis protein
MARRQPRASALRYEGGGGASRLVASGQGRVAERILELAREAGIPVREDRALAEALATLELESEVPAELYAAVAEALVWAHGLSGNGSSSAGRAWS